MSVLINQPSLVIFGQTKMNRFALFVTHFAQFAPTTPIMNAQNVLMVTILMGPHVSNVM